ncbi:MAG: hypothetical protein LUQ29_01640, partial [Methylococcaceae bacterium]|nr:hypothetical protein [Methylococcaceae bacterium]
GTLVSRSTMLLKYRSKPKFRFNKIYLRPLKNGRISKADDYFWKINRKLKAHYRPTRDIGARFTNGSILTQSGRLILENTGITGHNLTVNLVLPLFHI